MSVYFCFGSNRAGIHGAGAARHALEEWGAVWGVGEGIAGSSYAIPTKDESIKTLPLHAIARHVELFLREAKARPSDSFLVTAIGCGLAGYRPEQIEPMFQGATENVFLSAKLVGHLLGAEMNNAAGDWSGR